MLEPVTVALVSALSLAVPIVLIATAAPIAAATPVLEPNASEPATPRMVAAIVLVLDADTAITPPLVNGVPVTLARASLVIVLTATPPAPLIAKPLVPALAPTAIDTAVAVTEIAAFSSALTAIAPLTALAVPAPAIAAVTSLSIVFSAIATPTEIAADVELNPNAAATDTAWASAVMFEVSSACTVRSPCDVMTDVPPVIAARTSLATLLSVNTPPTEKPTPPVPPATATLVACTVAVIVASIVEVTLMP